MAASKIAMIEGDGIDKEVAPEARLDCMTPENGFDMGGAAATSLGMAIADAVSIHATPKVAAHG